MKKLLIPILAGVALAMFARWALADFGASIDGKEASVTCTHTTACDSGWVVFCYDGDAGAADTLNCYDSVRVMPFPSWGSKTFWGDGLDLDSIGTHVARIHYFSGDAVIDVQVGIWEHTDPTSFMADISGVSTFDHTSDAVIVGSANSLSFDSVDFKPDYWSAIASHADSGAIGASPWTTAGVGSVYVFMDSSLVLSGNLAHFFGACDLCYERHFPEDGTANKDSSILINPGLSGSDTLVAKVVFKHSNVVDVADSSYYYLNPWWE